jgi:hypothetical protein
MFDTSVLSSIQVNTSHYFIDDIADVAVRGPDSFPRPLDMMFVEELPLNRLIVDLFGESRRVGETRRRT